MASVVVHPVTRVQGSINIPGDKSISHRYALLAALADGQSNITHYAPGADCAATLACLTQLGVDVTRTTTPTGDPRVIIQGRGVGGLVAPTVPLDAQNSGTTLRLLAGVLAGHPFDSDLTGDPSLRRRPMRRIIDPLTRMGARLSGDNDRPPLHIRGTALTGIDVTPPGPSAQVKSAVLLAGLHASGSTTVHESATTRDHTERALPVFGVEVTRAGATVTVAGGQRLQGAEVRVPGDVSSAAFWAIASAALPGSDLTLQDVGLNPTRLGFLCLLDRIGAHVALSDITENGG
ncbi:MAG: 3-phosphoshikimate 1-carboxyvinyltransferase, partial [Acidobacteriota bacterium]|nr:3-phosphoshikimate 1-carboxyvinyltransferase [Acidobacteriota bacterium]